MKENRKINKKNLLSLNSGIRITMIAAAVLTLISFMLPFAGYVYSKKAYGIKGLRFLTGASVMRGTVTIPVNYWALGIVVIAVLVVLLALFFHRMKVRMAGMLMTVFGVLELVLGVVLSKDIKAVLSEGKNVSPGVGVIVITAVGIILIATGLYFLYKHKVVTALDFMVLPGALYFLINNYFPMFGMFIAFKSIDYSVGILKSPWVGIDNFRYLFLTQDAFIMTRNTILYNLTFIALGNILGIMVGIMLFELFSGIMKKFFQTTILMPQLISYVIVAYIVYAFLSNEAGFINKTILGDKAVDFYADQFYWPFILVFVNVWKNLGYASIIYLSSILGIDKSLYEAACVDGATKWQQIRKVTLPMLKPTVITLLLMQLGRMFYSDFGLFYQVPMNAGVLFNATQTIDTYVYRALMQLNQIGKASAASVYQSIIGFIVVLAVNALVRKVDRENAMF